MNTRLGEMFIYSMACKQIQDWERGLYIVWLVSKYKIGRDVYI